VFLNFGKKFDDIPVLRTGSTKMKNLVVGPSWKGIENGDSRFKLKKNQCKNLEEHIEEILPIIDEGQRHWKCSIR